MNRDAFTTCAYCPRLCRHVCPVAVATGMEAATPTAMMTIPLLHLRGALTDREALAATALCMGCGACTAHCVLHIDVAARLSLFRSGLGGAPIEAREAREPPSAPPAGPPVVFRSCRGGTPPSPDQLACCGRRDGFPDREPEAARAVAVENVRRFGGRAVWCDDAECAVFLASHGARIAVGALVPAGETDAD